MSFTQQELADPELSRSEADTDEAATIGALFDTDEARTRVAGFAAASRSRRG